MGAGDDDSPCRALYVGAYDFGGELVKQPIDVPGLTMMHDFALTAGHAVFYDLPVVVDRASVCQVPAGFHGNWLPDA
ncbi:carotenoid oxygenase family protein [Amycolatopsis vastitatis]|uniref:Dioxygenase n=1 Tax=Amycolatopsis vastitatis TaxID=1905142 RepID=A0A229TC36_9PSEU|nr:carotenoid oxygenase family protein [Amycolatopsis vastitatis]OXM68836.1 hypothetical protein CF165_12245 [Amycolatopsis vastitatis]